MRKLTLILVIFAIMCPFGSAYASYEDVVFVDFQSSTDEELQAVIERISDELKTRGYSVSIDISKKEASDDNAISIGLNQTIKVPDIAEFTITKINYSTQVKPTRPGDYYTYYAVDNLSNRFIDLTINIKNLTKNIEGVDSLLIVEIVYDNEYEYRTQSAVEASGGKDLEYSSLSGVNPLNTKTARFFVELPKAVVDDKGNIEVRIHVGDNTYIFSGN